VTAADNAVTTGTLWEQMVTSGRLERERKAQGSSVMERDKLPTELTPFGLLRWYLHPQLTEPNTRAIYFCELEIPPGSRSGRIRHQGGIVHFVVEGEGYTDLDGEMHEWERRDVIALPPRPRGVVFQHVNTGPGPVRLVFAFPNFDSALGSEMGVALEVLTPAPEFGAAETAAAS
jgi:quercetin dioxygenase-like cupin family protein